MNITTKLLFGIGILAGMIILLVTLSVVNLQLLTATDPDSPAALPALERALLWISVTGGICVLTGLVLLFGYRVPLVDLFLSLNKVFLKLPIITTKSALI